MNFAVDSPPTPPPMQGMEQRVSVLKRIHIIVGLILLAGVLPQFVSLVALAFFGTTPIVQEPLHESLELVGSCIAFAVALLLILRLRHEGTSPHLLWVVVALVAMGLLDGVHAVLPFGLAWSWLRHGSTFVGGALLALVWLPLPAIVLRRPQRFALWVALLAMAAAVAIGYAPELFPAPWGPEGYTLATKATNAAGGVGFLIAALFFLRRYLRQAEAQDLVLAGQTLLFSTSGLLFGFSHLWGADWWVLHGFRLLAYAVLLMAAYDVIATLYQNMDRHAEALEARTKELQRIGQALKEAQRIAHLGSWELDVACNTVHWSEEMFRIFAWPSRAEPMPFAPVIEATYPDDRNFVMAAVNESLRTHRLFDLEHRIVRPDGSMRWVHARGEVILDETGQAERLVGTALDITERKQAEDKLRASEHKYRTLLELLPQKVFAKDRNSVYLYCNENYARDLKITPAEFTGHTDFDFFPKKLAEKYRADDRRLMQSGDTETLEEKYILDGQERWVSTVKTPLRDEQGAISGILGIFWDITEQKHAEAEIKRLNAELEQRIEVRTAELRAANAELYSFAYAVSHHLRAPLRAMSGFSQALVEDYSDRLDGDARIYIDQISLASRNMSDLVDGLLTLLRSTLGELKQEALDISALAERLLTEMAAAEPARRVAWTVEPGMQTQGDAAMIEVVMRNLIDNAWKYTGKNPDATIRIYTGKTEGQRCFCVSDNGAGFDMAHASKLFQPFQRLHRQEEFPGIGIGLAAVQRIVHRHGGAIRAEGTPGQGATFYFTLHKPKPMDKETS